MTNRPLAYFVLILLFCSGCAATTPEPAPVREQQLSLDQHVEPKLYSVPHIKLYTKPAVPPQPIMPDLLEIPSIKLKARVEPVGVTPKGNMGVPKEFDKVGILAPWTKPGEKGNAVISGHFDHYTGPAIFYRLRDLKPGAKVIVSNGKGKRINFVVKEVVSYPTADAPLKKIFGQATKPHLNLITCSGRFNKKTQEHARRLVVFTELADPEPMEAPHMGAHKTK
ncbi:class F sortase [Brevibacillus fluminis]|uniref:class F sortase n=1 Tax=Brevibacillus fluminis TaxID=511487 RepID=UPI003F8C9887